MLFRSCREIRQHEADKGTDAVCQDPAVRLMVDQLSGLCGGSLSYNVQQYNADVAFCKRRLAELGLKPFGA